MDSLIVNTGGCGCFQVCHMLCLHLARLVNCWCMYLMVFGNYEPPWQCVRNGTSFNDSLHNITKDIHTLEYMDETTDTFATTTDVFNSSLPTDLISTDRDGLDVFQQGKSNQVCDDVIFDATSVTVVTEFGLICDQAFIPSIIIAVQMTGMLVGSFAVGQVGEAFGRKTGICLSIGLISVTTFVAAWSTSWEMYAACTFVTGVGCGGFLASHIVFAVEFLSPKWRGLVSGIPTWNVALLGFAVAVIGLKVWWQVHILTGCMGALIFLFSFWSPESVRWLRLQGRNDEVENVVAKIIKYNRTQQSVSDVLEKLQNEDVNEDQEPVRQYSYCFLFQASELRTLTIKLCFVWFTVNVGYFTLGFSVKALSGNYYTNLLLSCVTELPFVFIQLFLTMKLGRKYATGLLTFCATTFTIASILVFYFSSEDVSGLVIKYLALLSKGCLLGAWVAVTIFSAELFPTVVRSLAMGLFNATARIGGIVAALLIPRDQQSLTTFFIILSGSLLVSSVLIKTMPETKDMHMLDNFRVRNIEKENHTADTPC